MMKYKEFKHYIRDHIKEKLSAEYQDSQVSFITVQKNNNTQLEGLQIRSETNNAAPCIYLDTFYSHYCDGQSIDDIMERIAEQSVLALQKTSFDVDSFLDYSKIKDRIYCRLINRADNAELLSQVPHTLLEDLAVTYYVIVGNTEDSINSFVIDNSKMLRYGVTTEALHEAAIENMEDLIHPTFASMQNMLSQLVPPGMDSPIDGMDSPANNLYVLTNKFGVYGASVLLDTDFMDKAAQQIGRNFLILPSSIHEVLAVPMKDDMGTEDIQKLENMIKDVNNHILSPEERLSDFLYEYHADDHSFVRSDRALQERLQTKTPAPAAQKENPIKSHAKSSAGILPELQDEISM